MASNDLSQYEHGGDSNQGGRLVRVYIQGYNDSPDQLFETRVPAHMLLRDLAADFFAECGWPTTDEMGHGPRAVVELVNPQNPDETKRLDGEQSLDAAGVRDGDTLRVFPESAAGGGPPMDWHSEVRRYLRNTYSEHLGGTWERRGPYLPVARAEKTIRRYTDVSFPGQVQVGQATNLRVAMVRARRHSHDDELSLEVPPPSENIILTVVVAAENFTIEGESRAEIVVPREGDTEAVHFRLRADCEGDGRVMVDFYQHGRAIGSVDLSPQIVAGDAREEHIPLAAAENECRLRSALGPAPDVTIVVHKLRQFPGRLHFLLVSRDPRLKDLPSVTYGDLGSVDLHEDVVDWVARQLDELNRRAESGQPAGSVLEDTGNRLYERVLPDELKRLCWTLAERGVRNILVLSDEPEIPWELIKPYRDNPATGAFQTRGFWGEEFAITRWLRGPNLADRFGCQRVCAVAAGAAQVEQADTSLPTRDMLPASQVASNPEPAGWASDGITIANADQELGALRSLAEGAGGAVEVVPPNLEGMLQVLERAEFDLLHVISHGKFGGYTSADASAIQLTDAPFTAGQLAPRMREPLRQAAPLIFFNCCNTGQLGFSLTRLGSWSGELIGLGCGGFVGSLWRVTNRAAAVFAEQFYSCLFRGLPIGEAVQLARLAVREQCPNDPTWLAYCCFADPTARITAAHPRGDLMPLARS